MLAEPLAIAAELGAALDVIGVPWLIGGSVASSLDRVSERQWRDVLGVIEVNADTLDRAYLHEQAAAWDLSALLDEALSVP